MMAGPGGWRHSAAARVAEDSPARDDTWHERIARHLIRGPGADRKSQCTLGGALRVCGCGAGTDGGVGGGLLPAPVVGWETIDTNGYYGSNPDLIDPRPPHDLVRAFGRGGTE